MSTYQPNTDTHGFAPQDLLARGSSHRPPIRKRQFSTNTYHEQSHPLKKQVVLRDNVSSTATELADFSYPAPNAANAANGATAGDLTDSHTLTDAEFDSAGLELDLLTNNNVAAATNPVETPAADDIWRFVDIPDDKQPPPSVLRDLDSLSNSTNMTTFDPNLQFSPPNSDSPGVEENFDDKGMGPEISWDHINYQLQHSHIEYTLGNAQSVAVLGNDNQSRGNLQMTPPSSALSPPAGLLLRPYKAWFNLREMLEAKESMYKNQPEVTFELFARVMRTQRQNFEKRQLFQLRDLFKINLPYISGVLVN
ncbi:hypothetical protein PWT90_08949 [Aphanocladium album]|nr:hypothetical protein PWT90_08949 [Aphanocladium album]